MRAIKTHGATVIAVWRRIILVAVRSCASVGVRPALIQRRVGGTISTAPAATVTVPTRPTTTSVMTLPAVTTLRPTSDDDDRHHLGDRQHIGKGETCGVIG